MPIKVVGNERWLSWQPKGTSGRNLLGAPRAPDVGLGPVGMVGSVGYSQAALSPQAQKWERMGLYWTGRGVAQGRPLAEIEQGIGLAGARDARDERMTGHNIAMGLNRDARDERMTGHNIAMGLNRDARDERQLSHGVAMDQARGAREAIDLMSGLTPKTQRATWGLVSQAPNPGTINPRMAPAKQDPAKSPIPEFLDKLTSMAIDQGMGIDPASKDAPLQYERLGMQIGLTGRHVGAQMKDLIERYRPDFEADRQRRAGLVPAAGGAAGGIVPNSGSATGGIVPKMGTPADGSSAAGQPGAQGSATDVDPAVIASFRQKFLAEGKYPPPDQVIRQRILEQQRRLAAESAARTGATR